MLSCAHMWPVQRLSRIHPWLPLPFAASVHHRYGTGSAREREGGREREGERGREREREREEERERGRDKNLATSLREEERGQKKGREKTIQAPQALIICLGPGRIMSTARQNYWAVLRPLAQLSPFASLYLSPSLSLSLSLSL